MNRHHRFAPLVLLGSIVITGCPADDVPLHVVDAHDDGGVETDDPATEVVDVADSADGDCSEQHFERYEASDPIALSEIPEINAAAGVEFWELRRDGEVIASGGERCPETIDSDACERRHAAALGASAEFGVCSTFDEWSGRPAYSLVTRRGDQFAGVATQEEFAAATTPVDTAWEAFLLGYWQCFDELGSIERGDGGFTVAWTYISSVCKPVVQNQTVQFVRSDGSIEDVEGRTVWVCPCDCCI